MRLLPSSGEQARERKRERERITKIIIVIVIIICQRGRGLVSQGRGVKSPWLPVAASTDVTRISIWLRAWHASVVASLLSRRRISKTLSPLSGRSVCGAGQSMPQILEAVSPSCVPSTHLLAYATIVFNFWIGGRTTKDRRQQPINVTHTQTPS